MQAAGGAPLTDDARPRAGPQRRLGLVFVLATLVVAVDVGTKILAVEKLSAREPVQVIDGFLELTLTRNPGAAFGIGVGATVIFTIVAAAVVVVLVRTAARLRSLPWAIAFALLLGGAVGNLGDRIFREPGPFRGHVVDWIRLPHWPVFNLADTCIVVGAILAVLISLRGLGFDGTSRHEEPPEEPQPGRDT